MSRGKGKGGPPKVFEIVCADGTVRKVAARSPKAARQIAAKAGFPLNAEMNGRAVRPLPGYSPKDCPDIINPGPAARRGEASR
jgi:hypothetical protein